MGILDDTAVFFAIIQHGGFSHAAKHLGLSNGLISRRMAQLEANLGVTLIKRTTRQLHLTAEGEIFWQHAERIQQELGEAINLIQSSSKKPKGIIRISSPHYFGRHYLTPIIMRFLESYDDIKIDLILSNKKRDLIKEQLDLVIRGSGYLGETQLQDSNMQMKSLLKEKIGLYASPDYLLKHGEPRSPEDLSEHFSIHYLEDHRIIGGNSSISPKSKFNCNDIESGLTACIAGLGIGKFTQLHVKQALQQKQLKPVLSKFDWGNNHLYAIYPQQKDLPKRTRLLLNFIKSSTSDLI